MQCNTCGATSPGTRRAAGAPRQWVAATRCMGKATRATVRPNTRRAAHEAAYGAEGHIKVKLNSLAVEGVVRSLDAASQAGVRIDLVIRGICCLVPGVQGLSETITVRSQLGRYLEHSRLIWFRHGDQRPDGEDDRPLYLIGSADWMPRNLDRRVHRTHMVWG